MKLWFNWFDFIMAKAFYKHTSMLIFESGVSSFVPCKWTSRPYISIRNSLVSSFLFQRVGHSQQNLRSVSRHCSRCVFDHPLLFKGERNISRFVTRCSRDGLAAIFAARYLIICYSGSYWLSICAFMCYLRPARYHRPLALETVQYYLLAVENGTQLSVNELTRPLNLRFK